MARPRKTAAELELAGSFKKNPQRRRVDPEPKGDIGPPPKRLDQLERSIWRELVAASIPGVLKDSDRSQFETLCRLKAIERKDGIGGRGLSASLLSQMNGLAAKFGMTPADRPKLAIAAGKKKRSTADEFSEFDDESKYEEFTKSDKPN